MLVISECPEFTRSRNSQLTIWNIQLRTFQLLVYCNTWVFKYSIVSQRCKKCCLNCLKQDDTTLISQCTDIGMPDNRMYLRSDEMRRPRKPLKTVKLITLMIVPDYISDVFMSAMACQITCVFIVCSNVCSGADQRKYERSASLVFVRRIHRWPVDSHQ